MTPSEVQILIDHTIREYDRKMERALRELADDMPARITGREAILKLADELRDASSREAMN